MADDSSQAFSANGAPESVAPHQSQVVVPSPSSPRDAQGLALALALTTRLDDVIAQVEGGTKPSPAA